jgi:hypothetical protein
MVAGELIVLQTNRDGGPVESSLMQSDRSCSAKGPNSSPLIRGTAARALQRKGTKRATASRFPAEEFERIEPPKLLHKDPAGSDPPLVRIVAFIKSRYKKHGTARALLQLITDGDFVSRPVSWILRFARNQR